MMERVLGPLPYHMLKRAEYVSYQCSLNINAVRSGRCLVLINPCL